MNAVTKKLLGTAVGAGIGWFIGSIIVEVIHMRELTPEQLEEMDNPYGGEQEDEMEESRYDQFHEKDSTDMGIQKKNPGREHRVVNYTQHFLSQGKPELAALVSKYAVGTNGDETINGMKITQVTEEELATLKERMEEDSDTPPDITIISVEEYANAEGYQAVTLKYYEDDVLTDERDIPIEKPEDLIGEDALVSFGELSGDPDVVYVCNQPKHAMYEIVRTNKEYSAPVRNSRRRPAKKEEDDGEEASA